MVIVKLAWIILQFLKTYLRAIVKIRALGLTDAMHKVRQLLWWLHLPVLLKVAAFFDVDRGDHAGVFCLVPRLLCNLAFLCGALILLKLSNNFIEHRDLPPKILIRIVVIHELEDLPHLNISLKFFTFKMQVKCQFAKANGAHGEWLLVSLLQLT